VNTDEATRRLTSTRGDSIVAATGLALNEPVVGRDGDFEDVEEPEVEAF